MFHLPVVMFFLKVFSDENWHQPHVVRAAGNVLISAARYDGLNELRENMNGGNISEPSRN